ncbi:hypothetical protein M8C21_033016 [Ambrosia artemisiifolia]|uniref:Homogentisate solanesyltransferase, chloroplastic n=1 Tax=Ambrosia artemisiifolia TaxID=4212 RepID=A0AAD5GAH5_AMBAR|nr:hypothetical protein M8C21_033016 [Ambrosia artemisiifolia]
MELTLSSSSSLRLYATSSSPYTKPPINNLKCNLCHTLFKSLDTSSSSSTLIRTNSFTTSTISRLISNRHSKKLPITKACSQAGAAGSNPPLNKVADFKDAFWRFLRPHTIRGTALGSVSLVSRALLENPDLIRWSLLFKAFSGLIALICGNGYIVGINQIYDIGIDKVNKPYLPIAAGDLSVQSAWILVLSFAIVGVVIVALNFGQFITSLYCFGLFLGTIYSVPPLRMKRFPVVAFLIIATVRGFLLNFGVYYAISTFATKLGVRNIALLGSGLLLINYIGSILAAFCLPQAFRSNLMIPFHTILACCLIFQAWVLERASYTQEAIAGYYRFIWNLFYAEYIVFPFI